MQANARLNQGLSLAPFFQSVHAPGFNGDQDQNRDPRAQDRHCDCYNYGYSYGHQECHSYFHLYYYSHRFVSFAFIRALFLGSSDLGFRAISLPPFVLVNGGNQQCVPGQLGLGDSCQADSDCQTCSCIQGQCVQ